MHLRLRRPLVRSAIALALVASGSTQAAGAGSDSDTTQFSPYAGRDYPTRVFFGDTHLHTAISVDAGTMNTVGQEDAFRFARGEQITTTHGLQAKLSRPPSVPMTVRHSQPIKLV